MKNETVIAQSPGRINIIGEHTDYNEGFVLPAAIDKKTIFQLTKNGTKHQVKIRAENINEQFTFDLNSYSPKSSGWENYIMGVVAELQKIGANISGFDGNFRGNVPIGGGMSSSAALECSLAFGLNELFDLRLTKWQLIKVSQMAEHNFVGIKCGIMDQFASMMGRKNQVMLLDCRSLEYQYFPFDLGDYQLLLLNTNVSHNLAASAYNTRLEECKTGVSILKKQFPEINSLRDVSTEMLHQYGDNLPPIILKRCQHIVSENNRVLQATTTLSNGDFQQLGQLMYQSHFSLQNDYEVSCPELDFLVKLTLDKQYILGSRMMGGGFGGCTLNIIEKKQLKMFKEIAAAAYWEQFGIDLAVYEVGIEDGAGMINEDNY